MNVKRITTVLFGYAAAFGAFLAASITQSRQSAVAASNTLTNLMPTLYEQLDIVSRELYGFIGAVSRDHSVARASINQSVLSFATPAATAVDVTPGVTAPDNGDQTIANVSVTISKSRMVPIRYNGEEQRGLQTGPGAFKILADQFQQAFRTLGNEIEGDLFNTARVAASRAYGTAGTTPFGTSGDLTDIAGVRQILEDNGAPLNDLHYIAGSNAIFNMRGKQASLFKVNEANSDDLLRNGNVGRLEGLMVGNSHKIVAQTKGTGTAYTTTAAGFAVGTTSIPLITGSGTVVAGDIVTFAGDTNKYVVVTGIAAPGTIVIAQPGLRVAITTAATAMTIGNNFTPNIALARSAIVLATRIPASPMTPDGQSMDMADDRTIVLDARSGLAFEVSLYKQYRQLKYEVAIAWGQSVVKQAHIAVGLG